MPQVNRSIRPQFLCIHLPQWPISRALRRRPELQLRPVVVVEPVRQRLQIAAASQEAIARGIRSGMMLAEARALCPELISFNHDPSADDRARTALGRWMTRFTPIVATGWPRDDSTPSRDLPALLLLDLTGCERLFGAIDVIVRRVIQALAHFSIPARVAVAPTPGAAWAFASSGIRPEILIQAPSLRESVGGLPVHSLRLTGDVLASLHHLGIRTVGALLAMPRESLPCRFGPMLLTRLDQLLGDRAEPLTALAYEVPVEAKMTFDGPIDSLETLWLVLGELSRGVSEDLQRRGHGARRLDLVCTPEKFGGQQPVHRSVQLSRPSRDRNGLFKLLCCATERLNCGEGFVSIHLKVPVHERVSEEQIHLWEMDSHAEAIECDRLIERLGVRMGEASVVRPMLKESYLPERAWQPVSALGVQIVPTGRRPKGEKRPELADRDAEKRSVACRPLRLLAMPTEVRVMAEPSDDRDGRPCQLVYQGKAHLLIHVLGPERIAGEWWRGHYKTRDYYDAQDESGRRFWLFRVLTQMPLPATHIRARWFLHGFFE